MTSDTGGDRAALVLMVGAPASGKSTWTASRFAGRDRFSLDQLRRLVSGDELEMTATGPAVVMLRTIVGYRMGRRLLTVIDSTNTRPEYRAPLIAAARTYGVPVLAVRVSTPIGVCQARNKVRAVRPVVDPAYPGANAAHVPPEQVARLHGEAHDNPPTVGEVDAVLTINQYGTAVEWDGCDNLPMSVIAEPWLADTLDVPTCPTQGGDR